MYGEDALAGEHVENLAIETTGLSDSQLKQKYSLQGNRDLTDVLRQHYAEDTVDKILMDDQLVSQLNQEYH